MTGEASPGGIGLELEPKSGATSSLRPGQGSLFARTTDLFQAREETVLGLIGFIASRRKKQKDMMGFA